MELPTMEMTPKATDAEREFYDRVRMRAYELFVARGGEYGHEIEDWLEAERELFGNANLRADDRPAEEMCLVSR
jgi:hypothetical protein